MNLQINDIHILYLHFHNEYICIQFIHTNVKLTIVRNGGKRVKYVPVCGLITILPGGIELRSEATHRTFCGLGLVNGIEPEI